MSDPSNESTAPPGESQVIKSTDVGDAGAVLGLGGVTAQAVAGSVSPNTEAAPPDPAGAAAPEGSTPAPTGQAPAETAASATTPGATEQAIVVATAALRPPTDAQVGQLQTAMIREVDIEAKRQVHSNLNAIEQLALYWGGDTGTKIRNHVGRIRELLQ